MNSISLPLCTYYRRESKVIRKLFNGYFLIAVKPLRSCRQWDLDLTNVQLSVQNINPNDKLQYTIKTTTVVSSLNNIDVTVTISVAFEDR